MSEQSLADLLAQHAPGSPAWEETFLILIAKRRQEQGGVEEYAKALANDLQNSTANSTRLGRIGNAIASSAGLRTAINTIDLCQLLLELRKPRIAIYDHTWQFIDTRGRNGNVTKRGKGCQWPNVNIYPSDTWVLYHDPPNPDIVISC